jgi:predicted dehydrogenase
MKIGILGGGFGLYGYAVAAYQNGMQIIVKEDYKEKILARVELRELIDQITFVKNDLAVLDTSECLVFALPPQIQTKYLSNETLHHKHIYLEKPLAPTLKDRESILKNLRAQEINFSVGYLFPYTRWGSQLAQDFTSGEVSNLRIEWKIPRPESSWKMNSEYGGGIVNYYLIHLLKLLVDLKYDSLSIKFRIEENYCLLFSEQFNIELTLTENNLQAFKASWIGNKELRNFSLATPFGPQNSPGSRDMRIECLSKYLLSDFNNALQYDTEDRISKLLFQLLD